MKIAFTGAGVATSGGGATGSTGTTGATGSAGTPAGATGSIQVSNGSGFAAADGTNVLAAPGNQSALLALLAALDEPAVVATAVKIPLVPISDLAVDSVETDGSLPAGEYYIVVVPLDAAGNEGLPSNEIHGTVDIGDDGTGDIVIAGTPVANAASYRLYYGSTPGGQTHYVTDLGYANPWFLFDLSGAVMGTPPVANAAFFDAAYNKKIVMDSAVLPGTLTTITADAAEAAADTGTRFAIMRGPDAPIMRIGNASIFIGYKAGHNIDGGPYPLDTGDNLGIGANSLGKVDTSTGHGMSNVAVGLNGLANLTFGDGNVAIGPMAAIELTTGSRNFFLGLQSGYVGDSGGGDTTTGSDNCFVGYKTGFGSSTQRDNTIAIGSEVRVNASNRAVIGNASITDVYFGSETAAANTRQSRAFIVGNTAPADGDLGNGQAALWFDPTNGSAKLMIKAKQADGTVKTGSVNVTT